MLHIAVKHIICIVQTERNMFRKHEHFIFYVDFRREMRYNDVNGNENLYSSDRRY